MNEEIENIKKTILKSLKNAEVKITNPHNDGKHFEAIVIASQFVEKSLVEQHQMVMEPLKDLFTSFLHALSIKTYTPDEWKNNGKH